MAKVQDEQNEHDWHGLEQHPNGDLQQGRGRDGGMLALDGHLSGQHDNQDDPERGFPHVGADG
jgi:hypothetical protein